VYYNIVLFLSRDNVHSSNVSHLLSFFFRDYSRLPPGPFLFSDRPAISGILIKRKGDLIMHFIYKTDTLMYMPEDGKVAF